MSAYKRVKKKPITDPALASWEPLNKALKSADEAACKKLLKKELSGRARNSYLKRIYGRMATARTERERSQLKATPKKKA